jgi:chromosome segregation ATPase
MDVMQTVRMIEWLDEERRRDKSTIAQLEKRVQEQEAFIDQLKRQLNGLENDQSMFRQQFIHKDREHELLEIFRKEINQAIEGLEAKRLTAERESDRRNEAAREALAIPIRELEDRLNNINNLIQEIGTVRSDRDRLMAAMAAIQQRMEDIVKKIEEPERRIAFLEEQRRQDNRRLSDVQTTLPELNKAIDQLRPKIDLIEGLTRNNERRIIEVQNMENMRREELQQFLDQQNLISQQRDQQMTDLNRRVSMYDDDMQRNLERFEAWSETHRQMKHIVDDFERIGDRLERRINEVAEMQRLSEERFRSEWNDWTADDQMRWKEFTVSNDELWRKSERELQELRQLLRDTARDLVPLRQNLDRLWKLQRAQAELYRERYQALLLEYDKPDIPTNGDNRS